MWTAAAVLACALEMLGRSESHFHPIKLVELAPPGVSRNAEGFATHDSGTIHVLTSTPVFREAAASRRPCSAREAVAKIASIIVHEEWHLRNGTDERGAYLAQLTALAALGYNEHSGVYFGVKRSMLAVLTRPPQIASLRNSGGRR